METTRPSWQQQAACRDADTALFYPEKGERAAPAKAICAKCPVQAECLEYGLHDRFGIWGGLTEKERRVVIRKRCQAGRFAA